MKSLMIAVFLAASALVACSPDGDANECPEGFEPSETADAAQPGVVYGDCAPIAIEQSVVAAFPSQVEPYLTLPAQWYSPYAHWLQKTIQGTTYARYGSNSQLTHVNVAGNAVCQIGGITARCTVNGVTTAYACPQLKFGALKAYVNSSGQGVAGAPAGFTWNPGQWIPASSMVREPTRLTCKYTMSGYVTPRLDRK
jgi:hypothetical protein